MALSIFSKLDPSVAKRFLIGVSGCSLDTFPSWIIKNMETCNDAHLSVYWMELLLLAAKLDPAVASHKDSIWAVGVAFRLPFHEKSFFPIDIPTVLSGPFLHFSVQDGWPPSKDVGVPSHHFRLFFELSRDSWDPRLSLHIYLMSCYACFSPNVENWLQLCVDVVDSLCKAEPVISTVHVSTSHALIRLQLVELIRIAARSKISRPTIISALAVSERLAKLSSETMDSFFKLGTYIGIEKNGLTGCYVCNEKKKKKKKKNQGDPLFRLLADRFGDEKLSTNDEQKIVLSIASIVNRASKADSFNSARKVLGDGIIASLNKISKKR